MLLWESLRKGETDEARIRSIKNRMTSECQKLLLWLTKKSEPAVAKVLQDLAESPIRETGSYVEATAPTEPHVEVKKDGTISYVEQPRKGEADIKAYIDNMQKTSGDPKKTNNGLSFHGKVALITGASPASIATPVVKGLLAGGCTVVCAFRGNKYDWFRQIYEESAGAQARLICVPFNCGSNKDMDSVLEYVYGPLGLDIDFCLPFAALSENGRGVADLDSKSELAHRIMLTNVLRLVGKIRACKEQR